MMRLQDFWVDHLTFFLLFYCTRCRQ